jgi:hypothetical protein
MKLKILALLLSIFIFENSHAQYTDEINTNRPSESMNAFAVGKTVIQLEGGFNYITEKHPYRDYKASGYFAELNIRYGFMKEELEFITELQYQSDTWKGYYDTISRTGLRNSNIGLKYLLYDPNKYKETKANIYSWKANHKFDWGQFMPSIAVFAGANLNFSNNDFVVTDSYGVRPKVSVVSPKITLITQNQFNGGYVFVSNIFLDKIGTPIKTLGYIVTLTKSIGQKSSAFIENKGLKGTYYSDGIFSAGATYLVNNNLQVDFSVSKNYKTTPSLFYGGFGVSWRSDTNYKVIKLKSKGEIDGQKKESKKIKKEKEKRKKLLEELEVGGGTNNKRK